MGRKLTTVNIKGTLFYVDAFREVLRQTDNRENRIPFHVFDQVKDGYRFLYDTIGKNIPTSRNAVPENPDRYVWVLIPALMELDPEGIAMRYDIPLEVLMPEDAELIPKTITATLQPLKALKTTA